MITHVIFAAALLLAAGARAESTIGSIDFYYVGSKAAAQLPADNLPEPNCVIDPAPATDAAAPQAEPVNDANSYLLAMTGKNALLAYPKDKAQFDDYVARFSAILAKGGFTVTKAVYEPSGSVIEYYSPDGTALRRFLGYGLDYDANSSTSVAHELLIAEEALEASGLPVLAAFDVSSENFPRTFALYYVTKAEDKQEREKQLRVMKNEEIDYNILKDVSFVAKYGPGLATYIGREIGYVSRVAKSREDADKKLAGHVAFLEKDGAAIIGAGIQPVNWPELPEYKFVYSIYFYR